MSTRRRYTLTPPITRRTFNSMEFERHASQATLAAGESPSVDVDQRVTLYNVPWDRYEMLREMSDDDTRLRMTYLEGTLEIMSPSNTHERIKTTMARLIELYGTEKDIPIHGHGSTTF